MCVALLVCLSNTRHNASKKLLAKQQVDGNTEEEGKGERETKWESERCSLFGGSAKQLKLSL